MFAVYTNIRTVIAVTQRRYEQFFIRLHMIVPIGMMVSGPFTTRRFESSRLL